LKMSTNWDVRFLELAKTVAGWSKDPSSKIGAIAVKDRRMLSTGYNGFPRNIEDKIERLNDREEKYKYVVHAEMNCIYNATYDGVSLNGATLYVYGLPVCPECAKGIIQVGIGKVVIDVRNNNPRLNEWLMKYRLTTELFDEAGVEHELIIV
jgi:dCMP deaminase